MRLSLFRSFSSTVINLAKRSERKTIKGKADLVLVRCDSVVSGHRFVCFSSSRDSSNNSNFAEKETCFYATNLTEETPNNLIVLLSELV